MSTVIESAFFVSAVIPWWICGWSKDKGRWWWLLYAWCCCCWLVYYLVVHYVPMGVLNNVVELAIASWGLYRIRQLEKQNSKSCDKNASAGHLYVAKEDGNEN